MELFLSCEHDGMIFIYWYFLSSEMLNFIPVNFMIYLSPSLVPNMVMFKNMLVL